MTQRSENVVPITSQAKRAAQEFGAEHDRELLTILFTDLVDSTKLQQEAGNVEAARLTELHRKVVRDELERYDAREIEWAGDSCLAVFTKPSDAVVFALRMQAEHRRERAMEPKLPLVRVGIHLGEVVVKKREDGGKKTEDLFGLQVSEAARVMSVARGDQIYCTRAVFDNARRTLTGQRVDGVGELAWESYGGYVLKGSDEPVEICEVGERSLAPFKPPASGDKVAPVSSQRPRVVLIGFVAAVVAIVVLLSIVLRGGQAPVESQDNDAASVSSVSPYSPAPGVVRRYRLGLSMRADLPMVDISRDGSAVVFVAREPGAPRTLAIHHFNVLDTIAIETDDNPEFPFFYPDGRQIGYFSRSHGQLKRVSVKGGSPTVITGGARGAHITFANNSLYYGNQGGPMLEVNAMGGDPRPVTDVTRPAAAAHGWASFLPKGKGFLFSNYDNASSEGWDTYVALPEGETTLLVESGHAAQYIPSEHVVYFNGSTPMVAPFDVDSLALASTGVPLEEKGLTLRFSVSDNGTLVYFKEKDDSDGGIRTLSWIGTDGSEEELGVPADNYARVRISPDGRHAVVVASGIVGLMQFGRPLLQQMSFMRSWARWAMFANEGNTIMYSSPDTGVPSLYSIPRVPTVDRTEPALLTPDRSAQYADDWDSEGQRLVYTQQNTDTGFDIGVAHLPEDGEPNFEIEYQTPAHESGAALSPNRKWVAFTSNESGVSQVYVARFPSFDGKSQVSTERGSEPVWAPDGSAIYFRDYPKMMRVDVRAEDEFEADTPVELWSKPRIPVSPIGERMYDIDPDGDRFLMVTVPPEDHERDLYDLVVVENWFEELKRIAPHPGVDE